MKKYLIKTHYIATEQNKNFKGQLQDYYNGKDGISKKIEDLNLWFIKEYGYSRLCDAKRVLKNYNEWNKHEESYGLWKVSSKIVVYEYCDEDFHFNNLKIKDYKSL